MNTPMIKECTLCNYAPEISDDTTEENEDCPKCGGVGTVQVTEENEEEE